MLSTLIKDEKVTIIHGPAGDLEMAVTQTDNRKAAWGIICHPHPLYGGAMYNKVVTTLTKTYQELGLNTVRFNFRGVGKSEGSFDSGLGELDDLIAVMNWVQEEHQNYDFWLAGFSFGAYIATKAASKIPITKLVTIAPPVEHFPMDELPAITCPWVLVQGERDDVVPADAVLQWAETRNPQPMIIRFPEAGHFFHGQLVELRMALTEALQKI